MKTSPEAGMLVFFIDAAATRLRIKLFSPQKNAHYFIAQTLMERLVWVPESNQLSAFITDNIHNWKQ